MTYYEHVKYVVFRELEDYSFFENSKITFEEEYDSHEYYELHTPVRHARLRAIRNHSGDIKVEIEMTEGCWYEYDCYDHSVKYLWMAILNW